MKEFEHLRHRLVEAMSDAADVHKKDGDEWSAGRCDGLKQALDLLDEEMDKAQRSAAGRPPKAAG
jgi:hypothetical protein